MKTPVILDPADLEIVPIERSHTIPSVTYTHPEFVLIDQAAVFKNEWQLVGHISQLIEPGSSICATVADNPVIVIKEAESVRAFFNVCKHRGGPLSVKHGTRSVLQCQYHGWTYKMDGSLRGVPHFNHVELFDKKDFGLMPVKTHTWEGLIFVNLAESPVCFDTIVDGIAQRIAPINLEKMQFHTRTVDIINCNWKVYVDNFLEGYHIPIVHPELAKLLDYSQYVTETSDYYSLQYSPFSSNSDDNPYQVSDGEAFYYFIYPNIMLNILPGRLQTNIIEPIGQDRCRVIFDFYYSDVEKAKERGLIASDLAYSAEIQQEDIEICESVQVGLGSFAYDKGRFSVERESGVYHFQTLYKKSLRRLFKMGE
jgi:choline monooxygenase